MIIAPLLWAAALALRSAAGIAEDTGVGTLLGLVLVAVAAAKAVALGLGAGRIAEAAGLPFGSEAAGTEAAACIVGPALAAAKAVAAESRLEAVDELAMVAARN